MHKLAHPADPRVARLSGGLSPPARRSALTALALAAVIWAITGLWAVTDAEGMGVAKPPSAAGVRPSAATPGPRAGAGRPPGPRTVVLAFLPPPSGTPSLSGARRAAHATAFETELASIDGLSIGIMSATQGPYTTEQFLLDVTQGARVAASAYPTRRPPAISLERTRAGGMVVGWQLARMRAEAAPQLLRPGLLSSQIPGGAGYVGVSGADDIDGVVAANRAGRVAEVSLGSAPTLLARVARVSQHERLITVDLPGGAAGYGALRALSLGRAAGELLIVVQRAPDRPGNALLWVAAGGLQGGGGRELSSDSTNQRGLIAAVDLAPTILAHLGLGPIPAGMRGDQIRTDGPLRSARLRGLESRLQVIGGRRLKALACLLIAWALMLLASVCWTPARAWALRVGALGVLWVPIAALLAGAFEPSAAVEYVTITLTSLLLGALTDLALAWPRGPLAPAIVAIAAIVVDAFAHTQLLMRSLLGPNPILGVRFYGVGNELKSALAVLVLAAIAAALYPTPADGGAARERRRAAIAMACAGLLLAAVEGSARVGAGVGGVILVSAGFAVATVMLLPGAVTRRRALIVLMSPVAALVALAALDLATAHGSGHYTGSILHARSGGDLRDVIVRRYKAAWDELHNHAMPVATAAALVYAGTGVRLQASLLAPVAHDRAWQAAFAGGLTAGVVGALVEDSGPVLLVVAVFTLGCVAGYLWGRPAESTV